MKGLSYSEPDFTRSVSKKAADHIITTIDHRLMWHGTCLSKHSRILLPFPDGQAKHGTQAGLRKAQAAAGGGMHATSVAAAGTSGSRASAGRPALPRTATSHEAAALGLESARAMRAANVGLEAAECAFVEVCSTASSLLSDKVMIYWTISLKVLSACNACT